MRTKYEFSVYICLIRISVFVKTQLILGFGLDKSFMRTLEYTLSIQRVVSVGADILRISDSAQNCVINSPGRQSQRIKMQPTSKNRHQKLRE
jgi:hypothetical protein